MAEDWYYLKGGEQIGPVSREAVHEAARRGEVNASTYVWHEELIQWVPAGSVTDLLPSPGMPPTIAPPGEGVRTDAPSGQVPPGQPIPRPFSPVPERPVPLPTTPVQYAPATLETAPAATAALIFGILGLFCLGPIFGVIAIVLGVIARNHIAREPGRYGGSGLATAGVVLGIVDIVLFGIWLIIWLTRWQR